MTRALYDPVVEERGKMKGKLKGKLEGKLETARAALLKGADVEFVAEITGLPMEMV